MCVVVNVVCMCVVVVCSCYCLCVMSFVNVTICVKIVIYPEILGLCECKFTEIFTN